MCVNVNLGYFLRACCGFFGNDSLYKLMFYLILTYRTCITI